MSKSPTQFALRSRTLHWLMALLLLTMLFIGVAMVSSLGNYHRLVALHRPLGITIFILAIIRLINRKFSTLPPFPPTMSSLERLAASSSERLLYALMIALPLVGWGMLSAGHYPIVMFGPVHLPPILPANPMLYAFLRRTHTVLAYLLFLTFLAHLGAVLFHTLVVRDRLLDRMALWPTGNARETRGDSGSPASHKKPVSRILSLLFFIAFLGSRAAAEISFPGETTDEWHGFKRHRFEADGCAAWVVEPKTALPGRPWSWCMEFPDAFTGRCAAPQLLAAGFHHVHIVVGNTFGSPDAVKHFNAFYELLVAHGLAKKAVLIGLSRGGLYAYRFASEHPERVAVIYGDAPLCDIRVVFGGNGYGKGSAAEWANVMKAYGFKDNAEALAYRGNPVDTLAPLALAKVAIIHVIGDADDVVLPAKNSDVIEQRYRQLGGEIQIIHKPGMSHHPHGLDDPKPVVDFILKHAPGP